MPKGGKKCDKCRAVNGPRAKFCKKCGEQFVFASVLKKKTIKKTEKVDWRTLEHGSVIRVFQGYGPYWKDTEGNVISMGYVGIYKVHKVDDNGIHAFPVGKTRDKESGHCYIYMGKRKRSSTGMFLESHKIRLVLC